MNEPINCLRCRHAQTLPHTDFAPVLRVREGKVEINRDTLVPIRCAKTGRNRPAHLFEPCEIADPRPTYAGMKHVGGDRTKKLNPVARALLRAVYPHWPKSLWDELCAVMDRTPEAVTVVANRMGLTRVLSRDDMKLRMKRAKTTRAQTGTRMNSAQSSYILTRHQGGEWPIVGGNMKGEFYQKRKQLVDEIVAQVAQLGIAKTWKQISQHVQSMSPAAQRQDRVKKPRKVLR